MHRIVFEPVGLAPNIGVTSWVKFPTGITVDPQNFDHHKSRIKGATKDVKDKNLIIDKSLALINDIEVRYRLQQKELTADLLKREWVNPSRRIDFYAFFDEAIKERKGDTLVVFVDFICVVFMRNWSGCITPK